MKKCLLSLLLLLSLLCAFSSLGEETLPKDIHNYFTKDTIVDTAALTGQGSKDCIFVLTRTEKGSHVLHCFRETDDGWKRAFRADSAIPQGKKQVNINLFTQYTDVNTSKTTDGIFLSVYQLDEAKEYTELFTLYQLSSYGQWQLKRLWNKENDCSLLLADGEIAYYRDMDSNRIEGTVKGTIQRDIRYLNLSALPQTLQEARNKYTAAPAIPKGQLTAEKIKFTGGQKFAVYSGPGENYLRSANGKATVSTNDWIQVFGKKDGWILIQYAIDKDHMRMGWIPEKALPKKASVPTLSFSPVPVHLHDAAVLTDDPLFSQKALVPLPAASSLTWLATMGEWAYVEWMDGDTTAMGFLKADLLIHMEESAVIQLATDYLLSTNPIAELQPVTCETLAAYRITTQYDPMKRQWTVVFDSGKSYYFYVVVDDLTGTPLDCYSLNG